MIPLVMSIIAKTETFQRDMARARGHVGKFEKQVKSTSTIVAGLSRQFLALAGVGGGLYVLKGILTSSITTFASYEKGMSNISTLLDEQTRNLLPSYGRQIRQMSTEFGEGTEILSKGLYDIISASVEPAKAMKVLEVSVKAAKAGISDTATASDALTTILNSYGYEADKAEKISDILFTTIKRGKTTFGELAPNIGKVTSLAATAGLSFEELSASIATMTRAGVQSEIAITSLRALILSFLDPQKESIEAAKKFGLELSSNTLKTEGLTGVIKKLEKATAEELATIIPTSRAIAGFAAAIKNASGNADDYRAMLESAGSTQKAFKEISDDLAYSLEQTNQQWKEFKRIVGEEVAPVLNSLLPIINKVISSLDEIGGYIYASMSGVAGMNEYFIKILAERERKAKERAFTGGAGTMGALPTVEDLNKKLEEVYGKNVEQAKDTSDKIIYTTVDIAQAYVRMYDAIKSKSKESYEWRKKIIDAEYQKYLEVTQDEIMVAELKTERLKELQIEQSKATGGFIEGFGAGIQEMQREMTTLGELGAEVAETFRNGMVSGLNDALWKTRDLEETMKELGMTIAKMVTEWLLMQSVTQMMSALGLGGTGMATAMITAGTQVATALTTAGTTAAASITSASSILGTTGAAISTAMTTAGTTASTSLITAGATVSSSIISAGSTAAAAIRAAASLGGFGGGGREAHKGGIVGITPFKFRAVPASTFAKAPRLHSGLMSDEFPAILQRGEEVIPKGGGNIGSKLDTLISILSQRQTINANIIDKRDVVTRERFEGRDGESWTMSHIRRNS